MELLDQRLRERLNAHGIILKQTDISREQALVLLCQKLMEKIIYIWKTELFPDCLLEDFSINLEALQQSVARMSQAEDSNQDHL